MRSNFSKFSAASKHVLAMCARHEHATSHQTPAKIDMILCAGCISKVPKTRVQSKRKRFFKKPGGRAENIGLCCFECWSTFGNTATLRAVNFLIKNGVTEETRAQASQALIDSATSVTEETRKITACRTRWPNEKGEGRTAPICGLFSRVLYFSKIRDQSCYGLTFSK